MTVDYSGGFSIGIDADLVSYIWHQRIKVV